MAIAASAIVTCRRSSPPTDTTTPTVMSMPMPASEIMWFSRIYS
jgi:hypothetical protein